MTPDKDYLSDLDNLRKDAVERYQHRGAQQGFPQIEVNLDASKDVLYELQVHQIELEMQNDEMRTVQHELELTKSRYFDLYDLAPVGYLTVNESEEIIEVNLTAATMLGTTRCGIRTRPLTQFIFPEDQDRYYFHRKEVSTGSATTCELRVIKSDGVPFWVRFETTTSVGSDERVETRIIMINIDDRKKAEAETATTGIALRESEARYLAIIEDQTELICRYLPDGRLSFVNEAYLRYFGKTRAEVMDKNFVPNIPKEDADMIHEHLEKISPSTPFEAFVHRVILSDNSVCWQSWNHRGIFSSEGTLVEYQAVGRDITAQKMVELELSESLERWQNLFEILPIGVSIINKDHEVLECNSALENILKQSRTAPKPISFAEHTLLRADGTPLPIEEFPAIRAIMENKIIPPMEIAIVVESQEPIWTEVTASPLHALGTASVVVTLDITDRKMAEQKIRDRDAQFRSLMELVPIGIYMTDSEGKCIYANPEWCKLVGLSPKEVLGDGWKQAIHPDDREMVAAQWDKMVMSKGQWGHEYRFIRPDGEISWVFGLATAQHDSTGKLTHYIGVNQDVTIRKKFEEERVKVEYQLQQTQKLESLGFLAGGIAHDFNNLMGGVFGYIELAKLESTEAQVNDYLSLALKGIDRARGLTQQLLTFAKGGAPVREVAKLFPFVEETARFAMSGSKSFCEFTVANDLNSCNFDRNQICQVIDNMIINAQQSMPEGGLILVTAENCEFKKGEHSVLTVGNYVRISIEDCGTGIEPDHISHIFDPFFTTKTMGHGLGLATCYSIIRRHGGCIDVNSLLGVGTKFTIYLPAISQSILPATMPTTDLNSGHGTIIVMDDEEMMRGTISRMLKLCGYSPLCTCEGKEAIALFQAEVAANRSISALILDLTVPNGMGGVITAKEIRKLNAAIPLIVSSGYADDPVMTNPTLYGFTASIPKPFGKSELAELLAKYLDKND